MCLAGLLDPHTCDMRKPTWRDTNWGYGTSGHMRSEFAQLARQRKVYARPSVLRDVPAYWLNRPNTEKTKMLSEKQPVMRLVAWLGANGNRLATWMRDSCTPGDPSPMRTIAGMREGNVAESAKARRAAPAATRTKEETDATRGPRLSRRAPMRRLAAMFTAGHMEMMMVLFLFWDWVIWIQDTEDNACIKITRGG